MGVNSLPKTVTRQRRGCDLHPGPSAPESSTRLRATKIKVRGQLVQSGNGRTDTTDRTTFSANSAGKDASCHLFIKRICYVMLCYSNNTLYRSWYRKEVAAEITIIRSSCSHVRVLLVGRPIISILGGIYIVFSGHPSSLVTLAADGARCSCYYR